eukprot:NODE_167_length_1301_cov_293.120954_g163_i0.p1 GENE.NODE_167_length_1301_cov_293.120954_g163_i0~~NODE_167_length_1301_cov_293.120954_g163_i0.p1  ORF type:complete len:261 (+),score=53.20 NODE_167_length_1301_cov_293.120954_g163_i0:76-783(+)
MTDDVALDMTSISGLEVEGSTTFPETAPVVYAVAALRRETDTQIIFEYPETEIDPQVGKRCKTLITEMPECYGGGFLIYTARDEKDQYHYKIVNGIIFMCVTNLDTTTTTAHAFLTEWEESSPFKKLVLTYHTEEEDLHEDVSQSGSLQRAIEDVKRIITHNMKQAEEVPIIPKVRKLHQRRPPRLIINGEHPSPTFRQNLLSDWKKSLQACLLCWLLVAFALIVILVFIEDPEA